MRTPDSPGRHCEKLVLSLNSWIPILGTLLHNLWLRMYHWKRPDFILFCHILRPGIPPSSHETLPQLSKCGVSTQIELRPVRNPPTSRVAQLSTSFLSLWIMSEVCSLKQNACATDSMIYSWYHCNHAKVFANTPMPFLPWWNKLREKRFTTYERLQIISAASVAMY